MIKTEGNVVYFLLTTAENHKPNKKCCRSTRTLACRGHHPPDAVEDQADEEDHEEVVGVPEDLEVGPADHLHGRGDDEDEGQRDGHARQPRDGGEHHDGRVLGG